MRDVFAPVETWLAAGERVALATVVGASRSAPRPLGSKLAVAEGGSLAGSVSGGCVEGDVSEHARAVLATGEPRLLPYGIADEDAWEVGLPCGGEIEVFVELCRPELARRLGEAYAAGERGVLFTVVEGDGAGAKLLVLGEERLGDGPAELADRSRELLEGARNVLLDLPGRRVFAELVTPLPRLVVYGAVDIAEPLCAAARLLGWRTAVADARTHLLREERFPSAGELIAGWPEEALADVDAQTAVVTLTHDAKLDVPALEEALRREAFYVGALGSRRTQARRREQLRERGLDDRLIDRIAGPVGLDLGGDTPSETALAILGEIVAQRHGRSGGRLSAGEGPIHSTAGTVRGRAGTEVPARLNQGVRG